MTANTCHTSKMTRDPVCGMTVNPSTSSHSCIYQNKTYWFCCEGCKTKFANDPEQYLKADQHEKQHLKKNLESDPNATFTCPMHPEIVASKPGDCPKCGMYLEPMQPSLELDQTNPELVDFTHRFKIGLILGIPLVILAMGPHFGIFPLELISNTALNWLQLLLATPIVLWCGAPFFQRGWASIQHRSLNMFTLIAIGTGTAYLASLAFVLFPEFIAPVFQHENGAFGVYFEVSAAIIVLVLLGQILELKGRERTNQAVQALLASTPQTAMRLMENGELEQVEIGDLSVGDLVQVRPGEYVPADGAVVSGLSSVDESLLSGESIPVQKSKGETVHAGTINGTGSLVVRVARAKADSLLSQMINMVATAQRTQAPIQRLADLAASWFVPAVVVLAAVSFMIWAAVGPDPSLRYALVVFVSILIIACPCALGLATPMSVTVAVGRAVREGILVKEAVALELLSKVDTLVVDKTGTLTEGKPKLIHLACSTGLSKQEALSIAASMARSSEHPLAQSIVSQAKDDHLPIFKVAQFEAFPGLGVSAEINGQSTALGNSNFMRTLDIENFDSFAAATAKQDPASSVVYLAIDGKAEAIFEIVDLIKETTPAAIQSLQRRGIEVIMVTGDHQSTADAAAAKCGIKKVYAAAMPEKKVDIVKDLQKQRIVAMAGDGINDAPALAQANVGIAMGSGSDVSMECAELTLPNGDLQKIVRARKISEATMQNIRQNLWFAFGYNIASLPIAAGVFYPFFGILLSPIIGAAAMSLSSVSVIANALRLQKMKI